MTTTGLSGAAARAGATTSGGNLAVRLNDPERGLTLDLTVPAGRTLVVVGPNGAGKSTFLRTVAGLHLPAEARVVVGDRTVTDTNAREHVPARSRGIGLLDQTPGLFGHLTVRGNVTFGPRAAGVPRRQARTRADQLLTLVGAEHLARRRAHALSGGQAARVALARALAAEPQVLLLDEPFAAVDARSARELRAALRSALEGVAAIVVTHDADDVRTLADDVLVLDAGTVAEHGPASEVLTSPRSAFLRDLLGHAELPPEVRTGTRRSVEDHAAEIAALVAPALARSRGLDRTPLSSCAEGAQRPESQDLVTPTDSSDGGEILGLASLAQDDKSGACGPAREGLCPEPGGTLVRVADLLAAAASGAAAPPRRLAADAVAVVALPGFDNSQMDGYAVRSADLAEATAEAPVQLPVAEPIPAGTLPPPLAPGFAAPVMTGAPVPAGADAVVRVEDATPPEFGLTEVAFTSPVDPGTYVRRTGSDVAAGAVVLPAGSPLGAAQLGVLVAAGVEEVQVVRPPHVLVVSTGSELVPAGAALGPAQVHDANGAALTVALTQVGARVTAKVVPDEPSALRDVLVAADDVDLVVTSGGVSAGAYEVVRQTLTDAWFGGVAMQPGGPQGCGLVEVGSGERARRVPLVAFPGNPVSALVSFEMFLRPVIAAATGAGPARRPVRRLPLAEPLDSPPSVLQVRRGTVDDDGRVRLVGGPGSHLLAHLAAATVLVLVPPGVSRLDAGDAVDVWEIA